MTVYIYRHTTEKEQTGTWMWYLGSRFSKLQQLINKVKANSEKNIICIAILGQKQTQEMWKINKQGNTISKI